MCFGATLFLLTIGFILFFIQDSARVSIVEDPVAPHISLDCVIVLVLNHLLVYSGWLKRPNVMFTCLVIFFPFLFLFCIVCIPLTFSLIFPCLWFFIITYRRLDLVPSNDFLAATTLLSLFSMLMSSLLLSYRQSHVRLIRLLCISLLEALLFSFSFFLFFGNSKRWMIFVFTICNGSRSMPLCPYRAVDKYTMAMFYKIVTVFDKSRHYTYKPICMKHPGDSRGLSYASTIA